MSSTSGTGTNLRIAVAHLAPIHAVAGWETGDGHGLLLSAGDDGMIRSWDARTGTPGPLALPHPTDTQLTFLGVVSAPGGPLLVCAARDGVYRWELATGRPVGDPIRSIGAVYRKNTIGPVSVLDLGGVPVLVSGGSDGVVRRWDLRTGSEFGPPSAGHNGEVLSVAAMRLSDGRAVLVSGGRDATARRWDCVTGAPLGEPMPHRHPVAAVACATTADGQDIVYTATAAGTVRRWDARTGARIGAPLEGSGRGMTPVRLAVAPGGAALLAVDPNGTAVRWDLAADRPARQALTGTTAPVNAVGVVPSAGGRALLVSGDEWGALRRWDAATGEPVGEPLTGHPAPVTDLAAVPEPGPAGPDGRALLVSAGRDGARCWDAAAGEPVGVPPYDPMPVGFGLAPAWLPDGRLLLASGWGTGIVRHDMLGGGYAISEHLDDTDIWDVATGTLPDGAVFVAGAGVDGLVYRVDAATGAELGAPLDGLADQALAVAVATLPDGMVMIAGGGDDGRVLRWDAATGRRIGSSLTGHEAGLTRLTFVSPPGAPVMLVSLDDAGELRRWDAVSGASIGEPIQVCEDGVSGLRLVAVHATPAPQLLTGGDDEVVRRWDAGTGRLLEEVPQALCAAVTTLPDGRTVLAVGAPDGSIRISPLPADAPA